VGWLRKVWEWWSELDWRVRVVLAVGIATIGLTLFIYWLGIGQDPLTHFGAIFAAWVAGVALFAITGVVIAVISFARPELEPFDTRARILFRRQTGKHIDYIVGRIKEILEHYAEETVLKITIKDFHDGEKKYWVSSYSKTIVRSYIDDVETNCVSTIARSEMTLPPPDGQSNRLVFARVNGAPVGSSEEFGQAFARPINCPIDRDGFCEVTSQVDSWLLAEDEEFKHIPRRYTQRLEFLFENLLNPAKPVDVLFTTNGTNWLEARIDPGHIAQVVVITDLKPGNVAFNCKLKVP
jgi:hypothetical protein